MNPFFLSSRSCWAVVVVALAASAGIASAASDTWVGTTDSTWTTTTNWSGGNIPGAIGTTDAVLTALSDSRPHLVPSTPQEA